MDTKTKVNIKCAAQCGYIFMLFPQGDDFLDLGLNIWARILADIEPIELIANP